MAYTHTTYAQYRTELAQRLGDPDKIFWIDAELKLITRETLRIFSLLTGYWRVKPAPITTSSGTVFYDLATLFPSQLGYTVTDTEIEQILLYHLLEPPTIPYAGTEMFTQTDITDSMQRRRNQFLADTGIVVSQYSDVIPAVPSSGRVTLPETVIAVRRAVFKQVGGTYYQLYREDEMGITDYNSEWSYTAGTPYAISVTATPPLQVQLAPVPVDIGTLELLVVQTGAALDPATGVILGLPDDLTWGIKWGTIADILNVDGLSLDPDRTAFAQSRYDLAVALAKITPALVVAQLNGVPLTIDPLADIDNYAPGWQSSNSTPSIIGTAGSDLLAVYPSPDGIYSILPDIITKAPLPTAEADYIDVGRETLDQLLDYSEHLARFKQGGTEFAASLPTANRFLKQCISYNSRLSAHGKYLGEIIDQAQTEGAARPYEILGGTGLGTAKGLS